MASEISHVVYAARVLTNLASEVHDPEYWVGTLFPNIYQIEQRTRHPLHPDNISLYSLVGSTDFLTGLRVHAWIDVTRENYLRKNLIKERLPWNPATPEAFKLLEDDLLYDYFDDWDLIYRLLNKVNGEETGFVSDSKIVLRWHEIIQRYFKTHPDDESRQKMLEAKGLTKTLAKNIVKRMHEIKKLPAATKLLEGFWGYLEDALN